MTNNKPDWLQALEAQSWQAELIASGLAIYGSISLGTYIDDFAIWGALNFNERILNIVSYLLLYIYTAHSILVVSFILHLVLRILWAGILGLSSVYPKGINMETSAYPDYFKEKLKKDFPSLSEYSLSLDKLCSMIFSILCAMVMILVSIVFWIVIYLLLSEILLNFLPVSVTNFIGYFAIGLLFVVSILTVITTQGKFKNSNFSNKYGYTLVNGFSKVMYVLFYKPINYIIQTIRTNVTSKSFYIGMMLIIFISMFIAMPNYVKTMHFYKNDIFIDYQGEASLVTKYSYLDNIEADEKIMFPVIQSKIIKDNYLDLYIPEYKRETHVMDSICGKYKAKDELTFIEKKKDVAEYYKNCSKQYYTIYLDDTEIKDIDFSYKRNLYNSRRGFQTFIDIQNLNKGNHEVKITSLYKHDSIYYTRVIPFYKTN